MSKFGKAASDIARGIKKTVPDVLAFGGAVCISYGAFLFNEPLGFIVGGAMLICGAYIWSKSE